MSGTDEAGGEFQQVWGVPAMLTVFCGFSVVCPQISDGAHFQQHAWCAG